MLPSYPGISNHTGSYQLLTGSQIHCFPTVNFTFQDYDFCVEPAKHIYKNEENTTLSM